MKTTKNILVAVSAWAGAIAALDVTHIIALPLPAEATKYIALIPVIGAAIVHTLKPVIEKMNQNAIDRIMPAIIGMLVLFGLLCLPSCAGLTSAVTGQPIPVVSVQRIGGSKPFNVAAADVYQAENRTDVTWALYDAGAIADVAGKAIDSAK